MYIRENEFLRKTILTCLSGEQMGLIYEIKNAKISRDTDTLKGQEVCEPRSYDKRKDPQ